MGLPSWRARWRLQGEYPGRQGTESWTCAPQHMHVFIALPSESTVKRIKSHGEKGSKSIFLFCVVTVILFPLSIFYRKTCINECMTEQFHLILNLTLFLHAFKLPWAPMPYPMKQPNPLCNALLGCEIFLANERMVGNREFSPAFLEESRLTKKVRPPLNSLQYFLILRMFLWNPKQRMNLASHKY